jgi:hypothetical protein
MPLKSIPKSSQLNPEKHFVEPFPTFQKKEPIFPNNHVGQSTPRQSTTSKTPKSARITPSQQNTQSNSPSPLSMIPEAPPEEIFDTKMAKTVAQNLTLKGIYFFGSVFLIAFFMRTDRQDGLQYLRNLMETNADNVSRVTVVNYEHNEIFFEENDKSVSKNAQNAQNFKNYQKLCSFRQLLLKIRKFLHIFPSIKPIYITPTCHRYEFYGDNLQTILNTHSQCNITGDIAKIDQDIEQVQFHCLKTCAIIVKYIDQLENYTPIFSKPPTDGGSGLISSFFDTIFYKITGKSLWNPYTSLNKLYHLPTDEIFTLQHMLVDYQETFGDFFPQILNLDELYADSKVQQNDPRIPVAKINTITGNPMGWESIIDDRNKHFTPRVDRITSVIDRSVDVVNETLFLIDRDLIKGGGNNNDKNSKNVFQRLRRDFFGDFFDQNNDKNKNDKQLNNFSDDNLIEKQANLHQALHSLAKVTLIRAQLEGIAHSHYNAQIYLNSLQNPFFSQRFFTIPPKIQKAIKNDLSQFREKNKKHLFQISQNYKERNRSKTANFFSSLFSSSKPSSLPLFSNSPPETPFSSDGLHALMQYPLVFNMIQSVCEKYRIFWPFFPWDVFGLEFGNFSDKSLNLLGMYSERYMTTNNQYFERNQRVEMIRDEIVQVKEEMVKYSKFIQKGEKNDKNDKDIITEARYNYNMLKNRLGELQIELDQPILPIHNALQIISLPVNKEYHNYFPLGFKKMKNNIEQNSPERKKKIIKKNLKKLKKLKIFSQFGAKPDDGVFPNLLFDPNFLQNCQLLFRNKIDPLSPEEQELHLEQISPLDLAIMGIYNHQEDDNSDDNGGWEQNDNKDENNDQNDQNDHNDISDEIENILIHPKITMHSHITDPMDYFTSLLLRDDSTAMGLDTSFKNGDNSPQQASSYSLYGPVGLENLLTMHTMPVISQSDLLMVYMALFERKQKALIFEEEENQKRLRTLTKEEKRYIRPGNDEHGVNLHGINRSGARKAGKGENMGGGGYLRNSKRVKEGKTGHGDFDTAFEYPSGRSF